MKQIKRIGLVLGIFVIAFFIRNYTAAEITQEAAYKVYQKYIDTLNEQQQIQLENWVAAIQFNMYNEYYESWIASGALGSNSKVAEILLNEGYYTEHIDEMKQIGVLRSDYNLPSGTTSKTTTAATTTPEPITTTKCDEKVMWAKSQVNVRENGSTSYKKVGSLKKDEQVTVTGIDSTGWYEIQLSDGTVGHVSDKYLTEVEPSVNAVSSETEGDTPQETPVESASPKKESKIISIDGRTVVWYNAETDREEEVTFNEATPLDEVEEMANTYLIHGAELVESTPEPTEEPVESPEATAEISETSESNKKDETIGMEAQNDNAADAKEETEISGQTDNKITEEHNVPIYWIAGAVVLIVLLIGGGVVAYKKSHANK